MYVRLFLLLRITLLPGYRPVKMKPDQKEAFLLLLGLPVNPLYLRLARTSPFLFPLKRVRLHGWSGLSLPQSFLLTQRRETPTPLIILSVTSSVFPPRSLVSSCQATCVTRVSGKKEKKGFKSHWHASPKSIFGERLFFFFQNKKATGKNRQYWGVGVCFSFGQVCLLSCPANVTTTAL